MTGGDRQAFPVPCPSCQTPSEQSLSWLRGRSTFDFHCHVCGYLADINIIDVPGLPEALSEL